MYIHRGCKLSRHTTDGLECKCCSYDYLSTICRKVLHHDLSYGQWITAHAAVSLLYLTPERCTAILTNLFDISADIREPMPVGIYLGMHVDPDELLAKMHGYVRAGFQRISSMRVNISQHLNQHLMSTCKQVKFHLTMDTDSTDTCGTAMIMRVRQSTIIPDQEPRLVENGEACATCLPCIGRVALLSEALPKKDVIADSSKGAPVNQDCNIIGPGVRDSIPTCQDVIAHQDNNIGGGVRLNPKYKDQRTIATQCSLSNKNVECGPDDETLKSVRALYNEFAYPQRKTRRLRRRTALQREVTKLRKDVQDLTEYIHLCLERIKVTG